MRGYLLATIMLLGAGAGQAQTPPAPPMRPDGPPRGGPVFISPMGEPFHGGPGKNAPQDQWFAGADTNHDGALSVEEMTADAVRFFAVLDRGHDGEIDPDDIEYYETVLAPEIRVGGMGPGGGGDGRRGPRGGRGGPPSGGGGEMGGGGMGGGGGEREEGGARSGPTRDVSMKQGAARFGYLDFPEPVTSADRNMNRGVDIGEFRMAAIARFALLDTDHNGRIETSELPHISPGRGPRGGRPGGARQDVPPPREGEES